MKVAIIGAGAAGCFCAVSIKQMNPSTEVTVFERAVRPMAKLSITGGGRCNLTNTFRDISHLQQAYPRGWRLMQRLFRRFSPEDTCRWWEREGVELVTQKDQCIFPRSQDAGQVVKTLSRLMHESGVKLITGSRITELPQGYDAFVITTGGSPHLSPLVLSLPGATTDSFTVSPVPSLFALNIDDASLQSLMGTTIDDARVSIAGTKFQAEGTLLITHFGTSGPAILRLSSYAARHLHEQQYKVTLSINWMQGENEEAVRASLQNYLHSNRLVANHHPQHLTERHWTMLLRRANIPETCRWDKVNRKELNRLVSILTADTYVVTGRRTHKAEFVTCGGVALQSVNPDTLALRALPNVYLAGEVLDIDGITGGFNLQAAWTTGRIVAQSISQRAAEPLSTNAL